VQRAHRQTTRILSVLMVILGAALIVSTVARGGGAISFGVVLGVMFAALGAARFHMAGSPRAER